MPSVVSSGTLYPDALTETDLVTHTAAGVYILVLDTSNMAWADEIDVRIYTKPLAGSASTLTYMTTFKFAQTEPVKHSIPVAATHEIKATIQQVVRPDGSDINVTFNENSPAADTITKISGDWQADGLRAGDRITVSGTTSNNGTYTLATVAAQTLTLIASDDLTNETPGGTTTILVDRSYDWELVSL